MKILTSYHELLYQNNSLTKPRQNYFTTNRHKFFKKFDRAKAEKIVVKGEKYKDLEEKYQLEHFKRMSGNVTKSVETHQLHVELIDLLKQINTFIELIASALLEIHEETNSG